jgi:hypothetical protein
VADSKSSSSSSSSSTLAGATTSSQLDPPPPSEFDGVLGFSNGAAAAFLFAAHAAANKDAFSSLQFVVLAGGYLPEPLPILAPGQQVVAVPDPDQGAAPGATVSQLVTPLPYPSLHIMGSNDQLISCEDAQQVVTNFQEAGRQVGVCNGLQMAWEAGLWKVDGSAGVSLTAVTRRYQVDMRSQCGLSTALQRHTHTIPAYPDGGCIYCTAE